MSRLIVILEVDAESTVDPDEIREVIEDVLDDIEVEEVTVFDRDKDVQRALRYVVNRLMV